MLNRFIILPVLAMTLVFSWNGLFAATTAPTSHPLGNFSMDRNLEYRILLERETRSLQKDIDEAKKKKVDKDISKNWDEEISRLETELKDNNRRLFALVGSKEYGWLFNIAGKGNLESALNSGAKSWKEAIGIGVASQITGAIGNTVESKLKTVSDSFFDRIGRWAINAYANFDSYFFHEGKKPFERSKLEAWAKMTSDSFASINEMVVNGRGYGMRNTDQVSRQNSDESDDQEISQGNDKEKLVDAWKFSSVLAEQFELFIRQIYQTREYYEEDDIVIDYSEKICQVLAIMSNLLRQSKSLKDFCNKVSSPMIKAMHDSLRNWFASIIREVAVRAGDKDINNNTSNGNSGGYRGMDNGFSAGSFMGSSQF